MSIESQIREAIDRQTQAMQNVRDALDNLQRNVNAASGNQVELLQQAARSLEKIDNTPLNK